jgi:hypothetical protein
MRDAPPYKFESFVHLGVVELRINFIRDLEENKHALDNIGASKFFQRDHPISPCSQAPFQRMLDGAIRIKRVICVHCGPGDKDHVEMRLTFAQKGLLMLHAVHGHKKHANYSPIIINRSGDEYTGNVFFQCGAHRGVAQCHFG